MNTDKVFIVIQPSDYSYADVEPFLTKQEAIDFIKQAKLNEEDTSYWRIQEFWFK